MTIKKDVCSVTYTENFSLEDGTTAQIQIRAEGVGRNKKIVSADTVEISPLTYGKTDANTLKSGSTRSTSS